MLPGFVLEIIEKLKGEGFEAVAVGGCVRDTLLGRTPADWDIATAAEPGEVARIFEKTAPTGLKYGTVTVLIGEERRRSPPSAPTGSTLITAGRRP